MPLEDYHRKRDFAKTPEPAGNERPDSGGNLFVVQKHAARNLHYDFRLELDGVLKSWAVPKGPSLDPGEKRLAVAVEDHPLDYGDFEGIIPAGEYGGGTVMLWDRGTWAPNDDPHKGLRKGKLSFRLEGEKMRGNWALVQMKQSEDDKNWLLIKEHDDIADPDAEGFLDANDRSVLTGRGMKQITRHADSVWQEGEARGDEPPMAAPEPSALPNARRAAMPKEVSPQLATLVDLVPDGDQWIHEMKLDGYRLVAHIRDGKVRLLTRNAKDWTARFTDPRRALEGLDLEDAIFDGEAVVLRPDGTTDFQALQNLLRDGGTSSVVYYVFDILYYAGHDLRKSPQLQRKQLLRSILGVQATGHIRYLDHIVGQGAEFHEQACEHHLEGIICKKADAPYIGRRSRNWLKVKCVHRQEFVIGGFTEPEGSRLGFGALLVGVYDGEELRFCGGVGTGFSDRLLEELANKLHGIERKSPPFIDLPKAVQRSGRWVTPKLVCEVEFTEWTGDGRLRHPSFKGLRADKPPESIIREKPALTDKTVEPADDKASAGTTPPKQVTMNQRKKKGVQIAGVNLSSPDRVLFPEMGLTKQDLAEYYAEISDWILPHLVGRPVSLVRCPSGRGKNCFYQRHVGETLPPPVRGVHIAGKSDPKEYIVIDDLAGLITLIQFGALELHPWGCTADQPDKPDRLIFDFDPGEQIEWEEIVSAARELRDRLAGMGLVSFARLSGGKGIHVVIPLTRRQSWDEAKAFTGAIATQMARDHRDRFTANMSKKQREGRIYIDFQRNSHSATAVSSYSTRAREGAPVAIPVTWDELDADLLPNSFSVPDVRRRLSAIKTDPWEGFFSLRQSITRKMKQATGIA